MNDKNLPTILVIDDEKSTHILFKASLGSDFNLLFATNAQEGIDLITENLIHLILLDIQMPDLSGIEFMESTMTEFAYQNIPVVVITGKATEEIEQKTRYLGAVDFFSKEFAFNKRDQFIDRLEKYILPEPKKFQHQKPTKFQFKKIFKNLLAEEIQGDFFSACRIFTTALMNKFDLEYASIWKIEKENPNLVLSLGVELAEEIDISELESEYGLTELVETKRPYMTNNPTSKHKAIFAKESKELGLNSEIGIPLFKIDRETFMKKNMVIQGDTPLFGFMLLKRNKVFSTQEYKMLSLFVIQSGTVLWGLYSKLFKENA
ncbi:MAG: response regulator [Balneolaceae bacterium]|nr:response regulator [Balneolaceae bacterium]